MVKHKKNNQIEQKNQAELIDGYYIPKEIAQAYITLKQCCIDDLLAGYKTFCEDVKCEKIDNRQVVTAIQGENMYQVVVTPQIVSQVEKLFNTTKWEQFLIDHKVDNEFKN